MMANRLIDLMFERRGLTRDDYLNLERNLGGELMDMDAAVAWLWDVFARADGEHTLVVAPDFDMDGIMAGTTLVAGLSELGFPVELFVPDPAEGYGLPVAAADRLVAEHPRARWVVTCDMGISERVGIERLREHGLHVLVTDHHQENPTTSSRDVAEVVVDPCRVDETFPLPAICGAAVAWRVLAAYAAAHGAIDEQDRISRLRVLAGIGTISDLMPLKHENRGLVRDAEAILRLVWANPEPWFVESVTGSPAYTGVFRGLSEVLAAFNADHPFGSPSEIDEKFIGFSLAPTFNAAKRLGMDMGHAFNVFLGTPEARTAGIQALMAGNAERKRLVKDALAEIHDTYQPYAPVAYITDAPAGVVGLIASKLMDESGLPTLVVRRNPDGSFSGSGRSPEWYPFLTRTRGMQVRAAGHEGAFGVGFSSEDLLADQSQAIKDDATDLLAILPGAERRENVDIIIGDGGDVGYDVPLLAEFVSLAQGYGPFGRGWPAPRARVIASARSWQACAMGSEGQHLSITCLNGMRCVCWNEGELADGLAGAIEVEGELSLHEFMGNVSVELIGSVVCK